MPPVHGPGCPRFGRKQAAGPNALNANGGRGGFVDAIACPDGIRGGATTCQSGIDPAGAGLALLAVGR